jgi:hypothetical protein
VLDGAVTRPVIADFCDPLAKGAKFGAIWGLRAAQSIAQYWCWNPKKSVTAGRAILIERNLPDFRDAYRFRYRL